MNKKILILALVVGIVFFIFPACNSGSQSVPDQKVDSQSVTPGGLLAGAGSDSEGFSKIIPKEDGSYCYEKFPFCFNLPSENEVYYDEIIGGLTVIKKGEDIAEFSGDNYPGFVSIFQANMEGETLDTLVNNLSQYEKIVSDTVGVAGELKYRLLVWESFGSVKNYSYFIEKDAKIFRFDAIEQAKDLVLEIFKGLKFI